MTTTNTARVQYVRKGVNGYGVGKVVSAGSWEGDQMAEGDYVGIPAWMSEGKDYIPRDTTTSDAPTPPPPAAKTPQKTSADAQYVVRRGVTTQAPAKAIPWKLILGLGAAAVVAYFAWREMQKRKKSRRSDEDE